MLHEVDAVIKDENVSEILNFVLGPQILHLGLVLCRIAVTINWIPVRSRGVD
jgi:hypothetical protein